MSNYVLVDGVFVPSDNVKEVEYSNFVHDQEEKEKASNNIGGRYPKGTFFMCVLHFPYDEKGNQQSFTLNPFLDIFSAYYRHWACILHDQDIFLEDDESPYHAYKKGDRKPKHYHLVIHSSYQRRVGGLIKELSRITGLPLNCISVKPSVDITQCLRYLLHLDNPEKFQYSREKVSFDSEYWFELNLSRSEIATWDKIKTAIKDSKGCFEYLVDVLGIETVNRYNKIIYMYYASSGWLSHKKDDD